MIQKGPYLENPSDFAFALGRVGGDGLVGRGGGVGLARPGGGLGSFLVPTVGGGVVGGFGAGPGGG